jgi:hypothetical protein
MGVTDGVATAVEMFGTILLCTGLGWLAFRSFHSVGYFIGLTLFGVIGTMLRLYYQTKAAFREMNATDLLRASRERPQIPSQGFAGYLEADLTLGDDLTQMAVHLEAPEPHYSDEKSV